MNNIINNILLELDNQGYDDLSDIPVPIINKPQVCSIHPTHLNGVYKVNHGGVWYLQDDKGRSIQCMGEPGLGSVEVFRLGMWVVE